MDTAELPPSWDVWSDEDDGRVVLAFRPDVFDTESFPAPCLPTLYVTRGPRNRRRPPGERRAPGSRRWHVTLFLEPEVVLAERSFEAREDAVGAALDLARSFDRGQLDHRSAYQVPRKDYLDRIDELTDEGDARNRTDRRPDR